MIAQWCAVVGFAALLAPLASAQPRIPPAALEVPASAPTVTLITIGQGLEVFERFGHNALWFSNPSTGEEVAYHWGLFDFTDPAFLVRFLTGDTRYSMGGVNPQQLLEQERRRGRPITLQRLNLDATQANALREYVRVNEREENRYYRYDYYVDNCSTRLRDALDHALGGALRRSVDGTPMTSLSYRRESVRLTHGNVPVQAGIDIALGRPADVPLTTWQSFFIPMRLRDALRHARIPAPSGDTVSLVADEQVVPAMVAAPVVEELHSPRLAGRYALLGLALAALVVFLRIMMVSRRSAAWGLALFGAGWSLLCGVIGVFLLLAWFATQHQFWASNLTVLLLSPLSLVMVVLLPASLLRGRALRASRAVAALVAGLGVIALLLALVPLQEHRAIVALFLPVHLVLAVALALPLGTTLRDVTARVRRST